VAPMASVVVVEVPAAVFAAIQIMKAVLVNVMPMVMFVTSSSKLVAQTICPNVAHALNNVRACKSTVKANPSILVDTQSEITIVGHAQVISM